MRKTDHTKIKSIYIVESLRFGELCYLASINKMYFCGFKKSNKGFLEINILIKNVFYRHSFILYQNKTQKHRG